MSGDEDRLASGAPPTPRDLPAFLPYAAKQLQAPFSVRVTCLVQDEYSGSIDKRRRSARSRAAMPLPQAAVSQTESKDESGSAASEDERQLQLAAVHDAAGALVELAAERAPLPCMLLKLLALCAPLQPRLARLSLRACRLDARALHELCALLPASHVADLGLDDSPVRAGGYHLLLQSPSRLARLSLDRCALGDDGAAAVAAALHHPLPASVTLRSLSLSSNGIGDDGARAFGEALRSNRALQHLNLASNRITDAGAEPIFNSLVEFEVSAEESASARRRGMERLRRRQSVLARVLAELEAERPRDPSRYSSVVAARKGKSRKTIGAESAAAMDSAGRVGTLEAQAEAITRDLMGAYSEPFGPEQTQLYGGTRYCKGNSSLCWLNLAYNSLGQGSLEALVRVMAAQAARAGPSAGRLAASSVWRVAPGPPAAPAAPGLLRAVLEGNPLPLASAELLELSARFEELLDRAARRPARKQTLVRGRK